MFWWRNINIYLITLLNNWLSNHLRSLFLSIVDSKVRNIRQRRISVPSSLKGSFISDGHVSIRRVSWDSLCKDENSMFTKKVSLSFTANSDTIDRPKEPMIFICGYCKWKQIFIAVTPCNILESRLHLQNAIGSTWRGDYTVLSWLTNI